MRALNEQIERKAFDKANEKVIEAKSEKELAYEKKEESMDDLIDQMAKLIISQNKQIVGKDIAESAIEKVNQDTAKRRGRPKKQTTNVEGGTEDGQEEKTKRRNDTKSTEDLTTEIIKKSKEIMKLLKRNNKYKSSYGIYICKTHKILI